MRVLPAKVVTIVCVLSVLHVLAYNVFTKNLYGIWHICKGSRTISLPPPPAFLPPLPSS